MEFSQSTIQLMKINRKHTGQFFEDLYTNAERYQEITLISVGTKAISKELVPEPPLSDKYLEYVR